MPANMIVNATEHNSREVGCGSSCPVKLMAVRIAPKKSTAQKPLARRLFGPSKVSSEELLRSLKQKNEKARDAFFAKYEIIPMIDN